MEKDLAEIVASIVTFLSPFLPYITKATKLAGQEAVKKIGELGGETVFEKAKSLYAKIKSHKNKDLLNATELFSAKPADKKRQELFASVLEEALAKDKKFKEQILEFFTENRELQEIIANESFVRNIRQESNGNGTQSIKARKSIIEGVVQKRQSK